MREATKKGAILVVLMMVAGLQAFAQSVILLIPDGMSVAGTTLARFYKGQPLALDAIASGLVSTWSSDGTIADSAPAGSAYATGWESQTGNIATMERHMCCQAFRFPSMTNISLLRPSSKRRV
jgi:Alkaline phosphatase